MARNYENYSKDALIVHIYELEKQLKNNKYGLYWDKSIEKETVVTQCKEHIPVLHRDLERCIADDKASETHILIEGDNFHALTALNMLCGNEGFVDVIYIDPPYNRGEDDFRYNDKYVDREDGYLCGNEGFVDVIYIDPPYNRGEDDFRYNDKYVDREDGYKHSKWLQFMSTRLELARKLLTNTGVIIANIDEHEDAQLQLLLQRIFGENNRVGTIIWNKMNPKGDAHGISSQHETIFCFAKDKESFLKLNNTCMRQKPNANKMLSKAKTLYRKIGRRVIPDDVANAIKPFDYSEEVKRDFYVNYDLELINKEFQNWLNRQPFSSGEKAYKFIDENGCVYRGVSMAWPNKKRLPMTTLSR